MKAAFIFLTMVLAYNMAFAQAGSNNTANKQAGTVIGQAQWSFNSEANVDAGMGGAWEIIHRQGNFSYGKGGLFTDYFEAQDTNRVTTYITIFITTLGVDGNVIQTDYMDSNGGGWTDTNHYLFEIPSEDGTMNNPPAAWGTWTKKGEVVYKYLGGGQGNGKSIYPLSGSASNEITGVWIPYNQISVCGQTLWTDGHAFKGESAGATFDLPLTHPAPMAWIQAGAYECRPYIIGFENGNTPEFCVGQSVIFDMAWSAVPPDVTGNSYFWHLPGGKWKNEKWQRQRWITTDPFTHSGYWEYYGSINYRINQDLLTNNPTRCWYYNDPGGTCTCSVRDTIKFANGQTLTAVAVGDFVIYRPEGSLDDNSTSMGPVAVESSGQTFPGAQITSGDIVFNAIIKSQQPGQANWIQLISRTVSGDGFQFLQDLLLINTYGFSLDNDPFYNTRNGEVGTPPEHTPVSAGTNVEVPFGDKPSLGITATSFISISDSFKTYLVFNPDPNNSDNIWVTLGRVDWGWDGYAAFDPSAWQLISGSTHGPQYTDTDEFPDWTNIYNNSK